MFNEHYKNLQVKEHDRQIAIRFMNIRNMRSCAAAAKKQGSYNHAEALSNRINDEVSQIKELRNRRLEIEHDVPKLESGW
jgi:hypothetical protein